MRGVDVLEEVNGVVKWVVPASSIYTCQAGRTGKAWVEWPDPLRREVTPNASDILSLMNAA